MKIITIGRSSKVCDIVIDDPTVSRTHLQILQNEEGQYFLNDVGSTSGTTINGKMIASGNLIQLKTTDIVRIGRKLIPWRNYFKEVIIEDTKSEAVAVVNEFFDYNDKTLLPSKVIPEYYAGFWLRFFANLIDSFVVGFSSTLLIAVLDTNFVLKYSDNSLMILSFLIGWMYFSLFESSSNRATIGKMVVDIKVVDQNGEKLSFIHATGRYWSKLFSVISLGVGFLMAGFTEKKQALHDLMSNSLVVRT